MRNSTGSENSFELAERSLQCPRVADAYLRRERKKPVRTVVSRHMAAQRRVWLAATIIASAF